MIKVKKPAEIPDVLNSKGIDEIDLMKQAFEAAPDVYFSGTEKFEFKKSIYGGKKLKKLLWEAQSKKCVFCELKKEQGEGDVEHFRGKGGYVQDDGETLQKPGYYWLAYDWDNLFFSCATCNRTYKKNFFPLSDPSKRAKCHHDDLSQEEPLFIHPVKNDPEVHIEFNSWNARSRNSSKKGKVTIQRAGLNRTFHTDERMNHYLGMKKIWDIAHLPGTPAFVKNQLLAVLDEYAQPDKSYSLMVKCALRDKFKF